MQMRHIHARTPRHTETLMRDWQYKQEATSSNTRPKRSFSKLFVFPVFDKYGNPSNRRISTELTKSCNHSCGQNEGFTIRCLISRLNMGNTVGEEERGIILRQFNASLPLAINFVHKRREEIRTGRSQDQDRVRVDSAAASGRIEN